MEMYPAERRDGGEKETVTGVYDEHEKVPHRAETAGKAHRIG